jgi:signal transduction histidine kinase
VRSNRLTRSTLRVPPKWRPTLGLIVTTMLIAVLALPLMGLFFFRIYENQLIRQTEAELIAQAAVLAAVMQRETETMPTADLPLGPEVAPQPAEEPFQPILPRLDLAADDLRASRPDAVPAASPPSPALLALGARLAPLLNDTQRLTLAGFRVLDATGRVIAGHAEVGLSLAAIEEVAGALQGHFQATIRLRVPQHPPPPLYSLSRGTHVRVFVAMPVIAHGHVAGVIYASRTPSNVVKNLYDERHKVALAALSMVVLTLLIGVAFHRTISGPIRELLARGLAIARGDRTAIRPLRHHGTAEFAALAQGFFDMADSLAARSDFVATFAAHVSHELKSPLTAIQGAAELLHDADMDQADRQRFLNNILTDTSRMTAIVNRLRELARADASPIAGTTSLAAILPGLQADFPALNLRATGTPQAPIRMSADNLRIVLGHLADNARQHGAANLTIDVTSTQAAVHLTVRDDGAGISAANRARVFDDFFTTRRETGGTGMGLSIVRAMLTAHGGSIALDETPSGTSFRLIVPSADNNAPG